MRRHSLMIRTVLVTALTCVVSLLATAGAQAMVVDDSGNVVGVALVPGTRSDLAGAGISAVTSTAPCEDPWLSSDLGGPFLPSNGLCYRGGNVMHANETFALTWDADRYYWAGTRDYVEQFLSDVASGSGSFSSPYALTSQYSDGTGRAAYKSLYGGGCVDYGATGGSTCRFGDTNGSGAGNDFPSSACPVTGVNQFNQFSDGTWGNAPNNQCLTDDQIQSEVRSMVSENGLIGHVASGYTPLMVVLTPPGTVVCLDSAGHLCSANGNSTARFCSYHSRVDVDGTEVAYEVVPWVASWASPNGCDDTDLAAIGTNLTAQELASDVGSRLVSPLSQAQMAAITDPSMNTWVAQDGSEINDNGCVPEGPGDYDQATVGSSSQDPYFLQRVFNNAGVLESDPDALTCAESVALQPNFVLPSSVEKGDEVQLDGSTTVSTLMVPKANYVWSFGDGTGAVGPSVVHTFSTAGTFPVRLTVTDRGGNTLSLAQTITITGPGGSAASYGLQVRLQLMPQSLRSVLKSGLKIKIANNQNVSGIATVSITRGTARRAHIKAGRGPSVVIGRGTISSVKAGNGQLRLHLSHRIVKKLHRLRHVTFTIRLALVGSRGGHVAVDAAGRY